MAVETELLKSIPYFTGLSSSELDSVRPHVLERKAERGEIILYDGEPAEALFFVISGAVKVFKTSVEGKDQILAAGTPEWQQFRTDKCDPLREKDCIDCMACETACPVLAIKITPGA